MPQDTIVDARAVVDRAFQKLTAARRLAQSFASGGDGYTLLELQHIWTHWDLNVHLAEEFFTTANTERCWRMGREPATSVRYAGSQFPSCFALALYLCSRVYSNMMDRLIWAALAGELDGGWKECEAFMTKLESRNPLTPGRHDLKLDFLRRDADLSFVVSSRLGCNLRVEFALALRCADGVRVNRSFTDTVVSELLGNERSHKWTITEWEEHTGKSAAELTKHPDWPFAVMNRVKAESDHVQLQRWIFEKHWEDTNPEYNASSLSPKKKKKMREAYLQAVARAGRRDCAVKARSFADARAQAKKKDWEDFFSTEVNRAAAHYALFQPTLDNANEV